MAYIIGISGGFRQGNLDPSAILLKDGELIAGVEEERLNRIKHSPGFIPRRSINFCLSNANIKIRDVDYVAYHHSTYEGTEEELKNYFIYNFGMSPKIVCVNHHEAHAACSYFLSDFKEANIITIDFSGDNICTTLNTAVQNQIKREVSYKTPNSLGIFYSIITQYLGFQILTDEYKVMGLSAYGKQDKSIENSFADILKVNHDSYEFNQEYFKEGSSLQQSLFSNKLIELFGDNRKDHEKITQRHMDIAYGAQRVFERGCESLLNYLSSRFSTKNLCLSGGASMNCVMNSVLLSSKKVKDIFIPNCPGDSGNSIGAAYSLANRIGVKIKKNKSPFIGPSFSNQEIKRDLEKIKLNYQFLEETDLISFVAQEINNGKIIGWLQGKAEFGPRALGNRSILASPLDPNMKDKINSNIKFREGFRPFAPSVIMEEADKYFKNIYPTPYMNLTFEVKVDYLHAITHVDKSARVQTVTEDYNPLYYKLIKKFGEITGVPVILNTSLNIMGQPIVCTPKEALTVFGATGMDILVLGNYVLKKSANSN